MPRLPVLKASEFYALLLKFGCEAVSARGSHFKVKNPKTGAVSTVPIHSGVDLGKGLLASVLKQLDIDTVEFIAFLDSYKR